MISKYQKIIFSIFMMFTCLANAGNFNDSVFSNLDYGLYWAGADKQFEKAGSDTKNGSTYYDPTKPTLIYVHGWQSDSVSELHRESFYESGDGWPEGEDMANKWISAGYNIGIIYWNQFADESEVKDAEAKIWSMEGDQKMRWLDNNGTYHYNDADKPVAELILANYIEAMSNYKGDDLRIIGHSLGSQVAMRLTKLLIDSANDGKINDNLVPARVSILDAYFSNGSKDYLDGEWVGEAVRDIADTLIANGIAIDSYRTSTASSSIFVGDENKALHNKLAFVEQSTSYFWTWEQAKKHRAAVWLYLWSIEYSSPEVNNDSSSAVSAAASNELVIKWMNANKHVKQASGGYSKDPSDDIYKLTDRL